MSIFEYDEEKERELYGQAIRKMAWEEAWEQARVEQLTSLVQKKKTKGMSIQEVAELLEEEEETIAKLWDVKETSKDNHVS